MAKVVRTKQRMKPKPQYSQNESHSLTDLRFYVPPDTIHVISETFFPANLLAKYGKNKTNTTKQTFIHNKIKKVKKKGRKLSKHTNKQFI